MPSVSDRIVAMNAQCPPTVEALYQQYFAQQVEACPDAIAICSPSGSSTYAELDALSNTLANFLIDKGVGPDVVVPLCFEHSPWAVISMLSVVKAGGAFTFLDATYPRSRLEDIVKNVGAKFLLTSPSLAESSYVMELLPTSFVISNAFIRDLSATDPTPLAAPSTCATPSNLLYIIFTSGSTGMPKGVCIPHSAYLSSALPQSSICALGPESRVLQFAKYTFDISILETLTTLISGGCICIPDEDARGRGLEYMMNEFQITWSVMTVSLSRVMDPDEVPSLKTLLLGGEPLAQTDLKRWAGRVQLMNAYGPTEASILAAVNPTVDADTRAANIGWPVGGLLWVVDADDANQLVQAGRIGELAIEGPSLASGYLNDEAKTSAAFVENLEWMKNFPDDRKRRVYLTGDLVSRSEDDNSIIFVGRKDTQVKVRGFRIELGDVESNLARDALVHSTAAFAPTKGACQGRLVGVVVLADASFIKASDDLGAIRVRNPSQRQAQNAIQTLQDNLSQRVQAYMIPNTWFVLEAFPLTRHDKIDRAQVKQWLDELDIEALRTYECLPASQHGAPTGTEGDQLSHETGKSAFTDSLRVLIAQVLNLPLTSVDSNKSFVNLGGDSISAMLLMSRCKSQHLSIKVRDILRCRSITELSRCVDKSFTAPEAAQIEDIVGEPFGLTPIQQYYFQREPEGDLVGGANRFNQSFILRLTRPYSAEAVAAAVNAVVERHSMLRCRFTKSDLGQWQQFILPSSGLESSHIFRECTVSSESEIDEVVLRSQCAIHMAHGPVFVADLISRPHDYQLLSLIAHHAVVDLVSWRIIMQDLEELIESGSLQTYREMPLSFQAWYKLQLEYAKHHIAPDTTLPHNVQPPDFEYWGMTGQPNLIGDTAKHTFQLDTATTSVLMSAESHWPLRTDPVDIFLASVIHSLGIVFNDRAIPTVFREAHGREPWSDSIDISSSVGWFTAMYPVYFDSTAFTDNIIETIRKVKDAQKSVPKNGWPYFASRFNHVEGIEQFGHHGVPEITFDYLGLYQNLEREGSLFQLERRVNQDVGPAFNRFSLIEITAEVMQGEMQLTFEFNKSMKHQSRLRQWFQECESALRRAAVELPAMTTPKFTMSDFPLLQTSYDGLDALFNTTLPDLGIAADNVEDIYSTSPMQTGLLISQEKDSDLYQSSMVFRVRSLPDSRSKPVDVQRIEEAWKTIVQRHTSLRTVFLTDSVTSAGGDTFNQVVLKSVDASIVRTQASFPNELSEILTGPIHLSPRGTRPAHMCTICEADTGETYVRLDINHALFDATSVHILVQDMLAAYAAVDLPKAPPYRDFITHIQACDLEKSLQYWNQYLVEVEPSCLPILADGTLVARDTYQTVHIEHDFSLQSLGKFCQDKGITLPTLIKAAWAMVLGAYVGSDNVCFGYVVSGRDLPIEDIDNAVGVFINILACRADLSGSLGNVLDGIHADTQTALQHQHCSLAHVQRQISQITSFTTSKPLFNTVVNFQVEKNTVTKESQDLPLAFEMTHFEDPNEFAVCIDAVVREDSLDVSLTYRTSVLSPGQAKNVASSLKAACNTILSTMVEEPTVKTSSLHFLDPTQEAQIWKWNATLPARVPMRMYDHISHHASLRPDAPAIEAWDGSMTFSQLDDMSNKLSRHLIHLGVQRGSIVLMCFDKSLYTIVAMMAVLKAGGAFCLLDPQHISMERTRGLILDIQAELLLSDQSGAKVLNGEVATIFVVDQDSLQSLSHLRCCYDSTQKGLADGHREVSPSDPAYIMFTSGTTGKPKGIVTSHSAFCTAALGYGPTARISTHTRSLQWSSYTFDACLIEIFSCLMFGGCVCVASEQQRRDDIAGAVRDFRVNWLGLTPSVSRLLEPRDLEDATQPLKILWLMGEAMSKSDAARWKNSLKLINAYGPTECSATVTWNDNVVEEEPTNIGLAMGALCWIVHPNDSDRLMPIGTMGELVIEGFTLADGYLNNPEKTAEVFIKPPKWLAGKRADDQRTPALYRTGDICRYNSDGTITYLGRRDNQVKVNGQRIEPGEIEHHLLTRSSDFIDGVSVEVIKPAARHHRQTLVAFFTSPTLQHETTALTGALASVPLLDLPEDMAGRLRSLQDSVSDSLPPFMIPTVFIPLAAFPKAVSGKLDRKRLRAAGEQLPAESLDIYGLLTRSKKPLTSKMERRLQAAWSAALKVSLSNIDGDTSFFRVGGDSLSAIRLVSVARKKFGLGLSVAHVLKHPRLCDMAQMAEELDHSRPDDKVIIKPFSNLPDGANREEISRAAAEQCGVPTEDVLDIYPCSPLQEATVASTMLKSGAYTHQHVLHLPDSIDETRFVRAWEQVVQNNTIMRTRIVNIETCGTIQAVLNEPLQWATPECSLQEYLADDIAVPLSWGRPLSRYSMVKAKNSEGRHVTYFVWTAHHAVYDGWSEGLVFEQLEHAYLGKSLPELVPYSQYIQFLRSSRSDDTACSAFWTEQLSGEPATTLPLLPSNNYTPRPDQHLERDFTLNAIANSAASESDPASHIPLSTIIRAAWALITARYANAEDIVFGTTLSGRNAPIPNIARVNGPTITTVPIKVHIDRLQPISGFLAAMHRQAISMIPFEHWGLRNIGQVSSPPNSDFQNLLVIQPGQLSQLKLPLGLEMVESEQEEDFHTYPLIVECYLLGEDRVQIKMAYDGHVVPYGPQLAAHFEHLCCQLAERASDPALIGDLDLCTPKDLRLVFDWNHKDPVVVPDTIHDLFSSNARARPDATAVQSWDGSFSYAELDRLSTILARHLVVMGITPETVIPAVFEKSAWTVVAQIAILKAGGVICMLDPAHPAQRLAYIVETVDASLVLASKTYVDLLPAKRGRAVVEVGPSSKWISAQSQAEWVSYPSALITRHSLPQVDSSHAAYIVFTSGTTGKPKGSITEHSAYATASASLAKSTRITPSSMMLQYAAYAFDAYVFETFTPLMEGACVCIPQDAARTNPTELMRTIRDCGVTHALLTPSVARLLPQDSMSSMQTLILGGEAMAPGDRTWSQHLHLVNAYGPSECSVCSVIQDNVTLDTEHLDIGKMVSGRCWIVEPHNHHILAPVGCVGELLLESPGLARGYLKEPAKTAEVFIPSPDWLMDTRPRSRLYKTGDLVRYDRANGNLLYVGRKDMQVKLHGQRLELAEIEHHVSTHNHVESVVVTVPKAGHWKGKVFATLSFTHSPSDVTSGTQTGDIDMELLNSSRQAETSKQLQEIRNHLEREVPAYMVPTAWAVVQGIPLTLSRKIDKRKVTNWLEAMDDNTIRKITDLSSSFEDSEPQRAPASDMEQRLQAIIARVLNIPVEEVFLNRSFIALGGDSIASMEATARCSSENISVTVKDILQSKTIAQLAKRAKDTSKQDSSSQRRKFENEPEGTSFSLTPIQKLYFEAALGPESTKSSVVGSGSAHFNQSFFLELQRKMPVEKVAQAIQAIVGQHSMLCARFLVVNEEWKQLIEPNSPPKHGDFEHHELQSMEDILPIVAASQRRMNAEDGIVFSASLFSVANGSQDDERQMLFLVAHHLVIDLVSWRIILRDLEELFNHGHLFTRQPISFQTWAKQQDKYAITKSNADEILSKFGPPSPSLTNSQDFWGVNMQNNLFGDAVASTFTLSVDATAALLGRCNDCFATEPSDLFIAGLLESFASVFDDRSIPAVHCEGHGREPWDGSGIDLSGTVGWFTTIYPVHVQLGYDRGGMKDSIRRVKDARRRTSARDGWSYFTSRLLSESTEFKHQLPLELVFNYKGLYQQLERADALLREVPLPGASLSMNGPLISDTSDIGSHCPRMSVFDVSVQVSEGKASFTLIYNRHTQHMHRVEQWMSYYKDLLNTAAHELATVSTQEPTLADFPLLPSLDYQALDKLKNETLPALGLTSFDQVSDIFPCAPTQQGILISQTRVAGSYRTSVVFSVSHQTSGPPDLDRLMAAWKQVVARHSAFRTVFIESDEDGYSQVVLRKWDPHTLQLECGPDDKENTILERLEKLPGATYDQSKPAHQTIFCQAAQKTYIKLEISHTLIDGGSLGILMQDLSLAYEDKLSVNESDLPLYRDYVDYIQKLPMEISVAYWDEYLGNARPCQFPILRDDHEQIAQAIDASAVASIDIPFDIDASALKRFCRAHGLTHASLFQVAWALVLRTYVGSNDPSICFGYLSSGRDVPVERIGEIVGAVCNMLVFKMDLDVAAKQLSLLELIQRAQDTWTESLQHQFVPLADIQHRHEGQKLFNTSMSYRSQGRTKDTDSDDLSSNPLSIDIISGYDPSEFDVVVNIVAGPSEFQATFNYHVSCMTALQAENAAFAFNLAVKKIVENGSQKLQDFVLMRDGDLARAPAAPRHGIPIAEAKLCDMVISQTANRQPSAQAICSWDGNLTYHELETVSSRLAAHLLSLGIGPGLFVPVCMEKSLWAIVTFLAILKAGAAFVPMDATQPGRWRTIVEQTGAQFVIASDERKNDMAALCNIVVVVNKTTMDHRVQKDKVNSVRNTQQHNQRSPADPAYVIFTSGSTGTPKGVVMSHGAWCSSSLGLQNAWFADEQTRFLQFASYGFDATIGEVLMVLMAGGCVCSPSETERLDDYEGVVKRMAVNAAFLVPSFARTLNPDNIPGLQTLIMGGEAVLEEDMRRWGVGRRLLTGYGPTECSVVCSGMQLIPGVTKSGVIGRPYMCRYWVVDPMDYEVLLPLGAVGELLIEGPVLARDYLNNPEKTSAAFIENPPWADKRPDETRRFYRAGDLVQLNLADSSYRCKGRIDAQVKINAQRVELQEVEVHLERALGRSYPVAVEVLYKHDRQEAKLAAFIAVGGEYTEDDQRGQTVPGIIVNKATRKKFRTILAGVREKMRKTAPSYMIPSVFIPLHTIPLMSSGKTDRQKLRQIAGSIPASELILLSEAATEKTSASLTIFPKTAHLTELQVRMCQLWASVLGVDATSIRPDLSFFSQGGDSILAIKLAGICRAGGWSVSVAQILRNPSVEAMCRSIESKNPALTSSPPTKFPETKTGWSISSDSSSDTIKLLKAIVCSQARISPNNIVNMVEATSTQASFVTTGLLEGRGNTNYMLFELTGHIDPVRIEKTCRKLVARHPILRTVFIAHHRCLWQVVLDEVEFEFTTHRCSKWRQGLLAKKLIKSDKAKPVKLGQPYVRFMYLDGGKPGGLLIMRISHAQYDGMSIPVLFEDLCALYEGHENNDGQALQRPIFTDFTRAARQSNAQGAEEYWHRLLQGSQMTNIVAHRAPPHGRCKVTTIAREITVAEIPNFTFANISKASWALVLAEVSKSSDVVFGHLISGRNIDLPDDKGDINEVLGPCINMIPVRIRVDASDSRDILRQVYDQQLACIPYETFGLDQIVERCTDWPLWTRFSSIVQHQNLDGVEEMMTSDAGFSFGDASCRFGAVQGEPDMFDVLVMTSPLPNDEKASNSTTRVQPQNRISVKFLFNEKILRPDLINHLMDRFIANVELLTTGNHQQTEDSALVSPGQVSSILPNSQPMIPVLARNHVDAGMPMDRTNVALARGLKFNEMVPEVQVLVRKAWESVALVPGPGTESESDSESGHDPTTVAFYDIWGSLLAAAQLAEFYNQHENLKVSMEDMIEHPSMLAQSFLLAEKMGMGRSIREKMMSGIWRKEKGATEKLTSGTKAGTERQVPLLYE